MIESLELEDDEATIPATVRRPSTRGLHPGIVLGPGGLGRGNASEMDWLVEPLVEAGYVVVAIGYRAAYPGDDDRDFALGIDVLMNDPSVDPARIAVVGDSRGGMSALRTAAVDDRVRAVVGLAPPCDMKHNVRNTIAYSPFRHKAQLAMMGGEPDDVPERYDRVEAIAYADRIKVPVLLVHGTFDMHAPPEMSLYMERALRRHGHRDVTVEMLEGLGHFWERQHLGLERYRVVDVVLPWLADRLAKHD